MGESLSRGECCAVGGAWCYCVGPLLNAVSGNRAAAESGEEAAAPYNGRPKRLGAIRTAGLRADLMFDANSARSW